MIKLAKNKYGCRVVHIAFEFAEEDQRELLVAEIKNCSIVDMIMDQNANHVVQRLIELGMGSDYIGFLVKRITAKLDELCFHQYGCRVIQKIIDCESSSKEHKKIISFIINGFDTFVKDRYGNYLL